MDNYWVGIDGGENTGFALWNSTKKCFVALETFSFWETISKLQILCNQRDGNKLTFSVAIEDISGNKPTFAKKGADPYNQAIQNKISQDIGGAKNDTKRIVEFCEMKNIPLIKLVPKKNSFTKLNKEQFEKMTGCAIKCSQHARDGAMIVWGR